MNKLFWCHFLISSLFSVRAKTTDRKWSLQQCVLYQGSSQEEPDPVRRQVSENPPGGCPAGDWDSDKVEELLTSRQVYRGFPLQLLHDCCYGVPLWGRFVWETFRSVVSFNRGKMPNVYQANPSRSIILSLINFMIKNKQKPASDHY